MQDLAEVELDCAATHTHYPPEALINKKRHELPEGVDPTSKEVSPDIGMGTWECRRLKAHGMTQVGISSVMNTRYMS